jgi:hypothetical protein
MIELYFKQSLGIIAIFLTFIGSAPYIRAILLNKIKPHIFTWIIWGITTLIVFIAQIYSGSGAGSWAIGVSGVITIIIAILAYYKKSDDSIAKIDWLFLLAALSAIPLWYATSNPLYAVLILTIIDLIGYLPTLRKAYHQPFEEQLTIFVVMTIRNFISIAALDNYNFTNILFQAATAAANLVVIALVLTRRSLIQKPANNISTK